MGPEQLEGRQRFLAVGNQMADELAGEAAKRALATACKPVPRTDECDAIAALVRQRPRAILKARGKSKELRGARPPADSVSTLAAPRCPPGFPPLFREVQEQMEMRGVRVKVDACHISSRYYGVHSQSFVAEFC